MYNHVFSFNTEGGSPLKYQHTMEILIGYVGKYYKFSIDV